VISYTKSSKDLHFFPFFSVIAMAIQVCILSLSLDDRRWNAREGSYQQSCDQVYTQRRRAHCKNSAVPFHFVSFPFDTSIAIAGARYSRAAREGEGLTASTVRVRSLLRHSLRSSPHSALRRTVTCKSYGMTYSWASLVFLKSLGAPSRMVKRERKGE
jgi:hypothetical protein